MKLSVNKVLKNNTVYCKIYKEYLYLLEIFNMLSYFSNKSNETNELTVINLISKGTTITGNIICCGDIRIDGHLKGNIVNQGKLVMGPDSEIKGDINVESAKIGGTIIGNITVNGNLEIEKSARLEGIIVSNGLIIHEGANLNAEISTRNKSTQKPIDNKIVNKASDFSRAAVL